MTVRTIDGVTYDTGRCKKLVEREGHELYWPPYQGARPFLHRKDTGRITPISFAYLERWLRMTQKRTIYVTVEETTWRRLQKAARARGIEVEDLVTDAIARTSPR